MQATAASQASLRRSHTSNTILMNSGVLSFNLLKDFPFFLPNIWATIKNKRSKSGLSGVCCCVKSLSCVRLFATPWQDCNLPGSFVHGILQVRILEWREVGGG